MPNKRKRINKNQKEDQTIRTRLIEISLKLDDFIYHKKPISESEADMYIREVISYKTKCSKDERSLQVIEKIVRCMKSIIAELQETSIDHYNSYDEGSHLNIGAASPVYSLGEEDRTQFTQESIEEQTSTIATKSNKTAIGNTDFNDCDYYRPQTTQTEHSQTNKDNFVETITISDEDEADNTIPATTENTSTFTRQMSYPDAEMHRALSNLSLKDVSQEEIAYTNAEYSQNILNNFHITEKPAQVKRINVDFDIYEYNDAECSQSILNNFYDVENPERVKSSNIDTNNRKVVNKNTQIIEPLVAKSKLQDQNNKKVVNVLTAKTSNVNDSGTNNMQNNQLPLKTVVDSNNTNNFANPANKAIFPVLNITNAGIPNTVITKKINETQLNYTPVPYNANLNQTTGSINNKTIQGNSNNNKATTVKKKRPSQKKNVNKTNDSKLTKKDNSLNEKAKDVNNIKPAPKRTNAKKKTSVIPIYNNNVENDLSWVENIRFVREIQDDEYDRKSGALHESFWNNYYLPPNFDESDFL